MTFQPKRFRWFLYASMACILHVGHVYAASGDIDLLRARADYDKKNALALAVDVTELQNQNYPLAAYADYWLMLLNMPDASNEQVQQFLAKYEQDPFADRVRAEYLKKLGKAQQWGDFLAEWPSYQGEDNAVACYAAEARLVQGIDDVLDQAKLLWMQPKEQAANCASLYDRMQAKGLITEDDIMARLRLALAGDRIALSKSIIKRSKNFDAAHLKLIEKIYAGPTGVLNKRSISTASRIGRELNLFALQRLAKTDSLQALLAFRKIESSLGKEDSAYFYGRLAYLAAQRHEPQALQWFQQAGSTKLDKDQLAWYARAGLRAQDWERVLAAIDKMQSPQSEEGAWRYWKARALKAQKRTLEANTLFAKLSTERHYYGWLAQEELESIMSASLQTHQPTPDEVNEIVDMPAMERVEALQRLEMRWEAKMEWAFAIKDFGDQQLLAAAEYAQQQKWYDLAINTADKTTELHNFNLRYPTPYRDLIKPTAHEYDLDEAWVYGITRQESRFMHFAKSGVGAAGLMQLMPATAKWAARRIGLNGYQNGMIHDLDTNITLGTFYMGYTKNLMQGQETMATAAYNAGPSRAKKWAADIPLEGAIYAETIPFTETRLYVQKVMANAHLYAQRLGLKIVPLKQRLGVVPGKANVVDADTGDAVEQDETQSESVTTE